VNTLSFLSMLQDARVLRFPQEKENTAKKKRFWQYKRLNDYSSVT
jgi:hypothetical protein